MDKQQTKKEEKKCDCKHEIETLQKQVEEYKNKYLRALADYQNFENRIYRDKEEIRGNANKLLIIKLLSFLDGLDKAEIFIKDNGLKLIRDSLIKLLKGEGLEEIEVLNKEFDPYTTEAVEIIKGEKDNMVVEVLRKGYKLNGTIIRVAQVKVSKKS